MISVLEKLIMMTEGLQANRSSFAVLFQNVANNVGGTRRMLSIAKQSNLFKTKQNKRNSKDSTAQNHMCQGHVIHPVMLDFFLKSRVWEHLCGPTNWSHFSQQSKTGFWPEGLSNRHPPSLCHVFLAFCFYSVPLKWTIVQYIVLLMWSFVLSLL